jgi:hypothetical protein
MTKIYLVSFELGSESESLRKDGYAGAFVTCIVPAEDLRCALDVAESTLLEDSYVITDIDKVFQFERDEWTHDPEFVALVDATSADGEVRYGPFTVWGH